MGQAQLRDEILQLSDADTWEAARREWFLDGVYETEFPETCLCGHFPIIELCEIRNLQNGNEATVGNVCVNKFIGLPSDKIFQAIKRVRADDTKALNEEAIEHAFARMWITEWERDFYMKTWRKRALSTKQAAKRVEINHRVLRNMKRR